MFASARTTCLARRDASQTLYAIIEFMMASFAPEGTESNAS